MTITNSDILERVIESVADPTKLNAFDLSEEGRRIRFNYEGVRYIVYVSGRVTITENGTEKDMTNEAADMQKLLGAVTTYKHHYKPRHLRRK